VHAHSPHVTIVATIDDSECVSGKIVAQEIDGSPGKLVLFFASAVASATTNAARAVEQQRLFCYRLSVHFFTWRDLALLLKTATAIPR
jgi:hypothetical protein